MLQEAAKKKRIKAEFDYLVEEFSLLYQPATYPLLMQWVQAGVAQLDDFSEQVLAKIEPRLYQELDGWFEEELKMNLLAPIFLLSELKEPQKIGVFYERSIAAEIGLARISVVTDCMVASVFGFTSPRTPYFFLQEFKKSKGDKQDPEGQMLAAMIAAQHLNDNRKPLYGAYVIGRDWYFTVLEGRDYARSEALRLTQPLELRQVILTLRELKRIILSELMD